MEKQLNKLIDVIKVSDYINTPHLERDLTLVKVKANKQDRSELLQIADIFRAKIVDVSETSLIIEATGDEEKIAALISMLHPFGIQEMSRTGIVAMARGNRSLSLKDDHRADGAKPLRDKPAPSSNPTPLAAAKPTPLGKHSRQLEGL